MTSLERVSRSGIEDLRFGSGFNTSPTLTNELFNLRQCFVKV